MARPSAANRYLIERAALQDLMGRYFRGLDRASPAEVRACFTDDVVASYHQRTPTRGLDAMMASLQNFDRLRAGTMRITTHFMGNFNLLRLAGALAETETNAIAFLVEPTDGTDQVNMRSLRYLDRMRRGKEGWRICERIHTLDWSCRVPAGFAITLRERVNDLPRRDARPAPRPKKVRPR